MKFRFLFIYHCVRLNLEPLVWTTALLLLAVNKLPDGEAHLSLCPFHNLGIGFCPGCGLGRSITLFFHGYFRASFDMHPMGIAAVFILLYRIISLVKKNFPLLKPFYNATKSLSVTS